MWKAIFQNKLTIYDANLPSFVHHLSLLRAKKMAAWERLIRMIRTWQTRELYTPREISLCDVAYLTDHVKTYCSSCFLPILVTIKQNALKIYKAFENKKIQGRKACVSALIISIDLYFRYKNVLDFRSNNKQQVVRYLWFNAHIFIKKPTLFFLLAKRKCCLS
jgi:hypothetical protein